MATILMPVDPVSAETHALRLVPIVADLMPREVVDARRARRARWVVLSALATLTLLLVAWYALASFQRSMVRTELADATQANQQVQRQQQEYSEVTNVQSESKAITSQLAALLAEDLQWSNLLTAVRRTASTNGIEVTAISGQLAGEATAPDAVPSSVKDKTVGTLTVTGTGTSKSDVAAYVNALATVPGVASPYLRTVMHQAGEVEFTLKVDITAGALGGRHTPTKTTD